MSAENVSVLIVSPPERVPWMKYTIPALDDRMELVLVTDPTEDRSAIEAELARHARTKLVIMDKTRSQIPVYFNPWALGVNIGVKRCSHDAVYGTHPECIQVGTIERARSIFEPDKVIYFKAYKTRPQIWEMKPWIGIDINDDRIRKPAFVSSDKIRNGVEGGPWWWFGVVFSKQAFVDVGGIDESVLNGFGCEDDVLAHTFHNAGYRLKCDDEACVIHLWHNDPAANKRIIAGYRHNYNLANDYLKYQVRRANTAFDWGSDSCVMSEEQWPA